MSPDVKGFNLNNLDIVCQDILFLLLNYCLENRITNVQKLFGQSIALRRYELSSADLIYAHDFYASMGRTKIRAINGPYAPLTKLLRKDGFKKKIIIDLKVIALIMASMRRD